MKLYVKYCGGCNPRVDRKALVTEAAGTLGAKLIYEECPDDEVCLLVSGCERGCLRSLDNSHSVAVNHLDRPETIVEKILRIKDKR